jgi:hypothetical protein
VLAGCKPLHAGSTMNLLVNIGIYGTLCKELGLEFRYVQLRWPGFT